MTDQKWNLIEGHLGNSLTGPAEGTASQMVHPPRSPVVENVGMTVSQHAELIFDHCRSSFCTYSVQLESDP